MRDFYPEDMRVQNWLFDHWRAVSRSFGFQEFDGPIFEFLDLYRIKSGDEILKQGFQVSRPDEPDARFAIRPEMTPTLARMVAARANALPRPAKWFCIPRMCRGERQQRGRLREFFQWNLDVVGVEPPLADAEIIAAVAELFRRMGITADDAVIRISHRPLMAVLLENLGIPAGAMEEAFRLIDKRDPDEPGAFAQAWTPSFGAPVPAERIDELLATGTLDGCLEQAQRAGEAGAAIAAELRSLWSMLTSFGVADYCQFDLTVVRGLAYYTGMVFEAHPRRGSIKALCGGGRYDHLIALFGGPSVPAVGMGMGDARVLDLLAELGRMPTLDDRLDAFVIDADESLFPAALGIANRLRAAGLAVDFSYRRQALGKQLKQASSRNARFAVIVGGELAESGEVTLKDLSSGEQRRLRSEGLAEALRPSV